MVRFLISKIFLSEYLSLYTAILHQTIYFLQRKLLKMLLHWEKVETWKMYIHIKGSRHIASCVRSDGHSSLSIHICSTKTTDDLLSHHCNRRSSVKIRNYELCRVILGHRISFTLCCFLTHCSCEQDVTNNDANMSSYDLIHILNIFLHIYYLCEQIKHAVKK